MGKIVSYPSEKLSPRNQTDSEDIELDVFGTEVVKQTPPTAEQHVHQVDLHLVELPRPQQRLCGVGAVDHHVLVTRAGFRKGRCPGSRG